MKSLAVVLPRYGKSLGGGAETLTKEVIERLTGLSRLEVWTTCATDHRTWQNHHPAGESFEAGVRVLRFPVDDRDLETFIQAEIAMRDGQLLTVSQQLDWLQSGVNSTALYSHIAQYGREFDALLFAPYLFPTSFWGALIWPERSILIPCLHNEHYAYQDVFRYLFQSVRGLLFNASPEMELCREVCGVSGRGAVVGMGFDDIQVEGRSPRAPERPYFLYCGRKEQGKNLDLLIDFFDEFVRSAPFEEPNRPLLAIIGSGEIHFRQTLPPDVVDLGFVSEEEKRQLMKEAVALLQPSVNESFSIVMMESWLQGTPTVVHAQCAVTRDHVVRSGGGLFFANVGEFSAVLNRLLVDHPLREKLGRSGREYVLTEYSWSAVTARFWRAMEQFGLMNPEGEDTIPRYSESNSGEQFTGENLQEHNDDRV